MIVASPIERRSGGVSSCTSTIGVHVRSSWWAMPVADVGGQHREDPVDDVAAVRGGP